MKHWQRVAACSAVVVGIVFATLVAGEIWRRQELYWYDVGRDYDYEFDARAVRTVPVQVMRDGFRMPRAATGWNSALLEIRVAARWSGWWFEPCIDVTADGDTTRQCFERGARGKRYLLLPHPLGAPAAAVRLRGRHLGWKPQSARLLMFKAPELSHARVLVLAPHPDDAEIAAFGLYSSHDSYVATMTAGNYVDGLYGQLPLDVAAQDAWRGEIRVWDSLVVPQLGGVSPDRVVNLGYLTHSLRAYYLAGSQPSANAGTSTRLVSGYRQGALTQLLGGRAASPDWNSVVADLVALVQATRPDVIVSPHPALDIAADHQYTTIALLEALGQLQDTTTTLLLYTNHHTLSEHYPFGPSTAVVTVPPWFGGTRFSGIFSQPLDDTAQLRKLFALESMHDLRAAPARVDSGPTGVLLQRLGQALRLVQRDPVGDYTYFRRAVRPNELFFVYPPAARPTVAESIAATEFTSPTPVPSRGASPTGQ